MLLTPVVQCVHVTNRPPHWPETNQTFKPWNYGTLRTLLADESLPCMVVDIDAVERNADRFAVVARVTHCAVWGGCWEAVM